MEINEWKEIKELLESQYRDVLPPPHLKRRIIAAIEMIKTLRDLSLLYTRGLMYVLEQWRTKGGNS